MLGNPVGERYFFMPMMINSMREEWFAVKPSDGTDYNSTSWSDADNVVGFKFKGGDNASKPYVLKGGGTVEGSNDGVEGKYDYGNMRKTTGFVSTGSGTDTIMGSIRITALDSRHIIIADIDPESMQGDKYYIPQAAVVPYPKNSDTTHVGVTDPIAQSNVLKVYPNPAHDQLTVEVAGKGRTWVNLVDLYGRVVKNVYNGMLEEGQNGQFPLNTSEVSSGIYFLTVQGKKNEAIKVEIIH